MIAATIRNNFKAAEGLTAADIRTMIATLQRELAKVARGRRRRPAGRSSSWQPDQTLRLCLLVFRAGPRTETIAIDTTNIKDKTELWPGFGRCISLTERPRRPSRYNPG